MITTVVQRPPPPPPFAGSQQATRCSICRANWPIRSVLPRSGSGISWCRCIPGSRGSRGSRGTRGTRGPVSGQMKTTIRGLYVRCASCREWNNLLHSPLTRFAVFFSFCFLFFFRFRFSVFCLLFSVFWPCFAAAPALNWIFHRPSRLAGFGFVAALFCNPTPTLARKPPTTYCPTAITITNAANGPKTGTESLNCTAGARPGPARPARNVRNQVTKYMCNYLRYQMGIIEKRAVNIET